MNWQVVKGGWVRWRGRLRMRWGRMMDDHLNVLDGRRELLLGELQEAYGITNDEAERQVTAWEDEVAEADRRFSRAAEARRAP